MWSRFLFPLVALLAVAFAQDVNDRAGGLDESQLVEALADTGFDVSILDGYLTTNGTQGNGSCSSNCKALATAYKDQVIFQGDSNYDSYTASFWSNLQAEVDPSCAFKPKFANEVSAAILLAQLTSCPFAVSSGGHAAFSGASNSKGGVTISLINLKNVSLSEDKKIAYVEPGNRWAEVFEKLAPSDVVVIGGRVSDVGTGGLTTGGGISFFSNRYGWACDNVVSYEVVLASGSIVTVTKDTYPDLYWALRGGGNNFGIVTKFGYEAYPQSPNMWGGNIIYNITNVQAGLDAMINFASNSPQDPDAAIYFVVGKGFSLVNVAYSKPVETVPPILQDFTTIPILQDTTSNNTLLGLIKAINDSNPYGFREVYWETTYKLNIEHATYTSDLCQSMIASILDVPGLTPACIYQFITEGVLQNMLKNGGNPLGLNVDEGPYMIFHISVMWSNATDDTRIYRAVEKAQTNAMAKAKTMGLDTTYVYMNYASQFQDPIAGYGLANQARLIEIARKYDPAGVFQTLQPGYFKLNSGPPVKSVP